MKQVAMKIQLKKNQKPTQLNKYCPLHINEDLMGSAENSGGREVFQFVQPHYENLKGDGS